MSISTLQLVDDYAQRALEQRQAALASANRRRTAAARFKEALKTGKPTIEGLKSAADIALYPPEDLGVITTEDLITSVRGMGKTKARQILRDADVRCNDRLRDLTPRRRMQLVIALRTKAATYHSTLDQTEIETAA